MSVTDNKIDPNAESAVDELVKEIVTAVAQAGVIFHFHQFRKARKVLGLEVFARTVTATISLDVGLVQPGQTLDAAVLSVGADTIRIKNTGPLRYVSGDGIYRNQATLDNQPFSPAAGGANATINVAAAVGQFWGAARIQIDGAGVLSTKVSAANQSFLVEADAVQALPAADANCTSLGYVTVRTKANVSFTFNVGVITGAGGGANDAATVNWTSVASAYLTILTGAVVPVAADIVNGVLQGALARIIAKKGALVVLKLTTDATGAATNLSATIRSRPYPLDGEVYFG